MKKIVVAGLAALMVTGCSTRIADLTVVSTKNFNLNSGNLEIGSRVKGASTAPVVFFPLGQPNLKEAVDNAIEKDSCAVGLSDVVIYYNQYAFIFGSISISVKGNLILDKSLSGCGGYSVSNQQPQRNYVQPVNNTSNKQQQIDALQQQNLPYAEYQRRYNEIMAQ